MTEVSIVIVGYNARPHFQDCLGSIFGQTFQDFEVLWVDSASTDGSLESIQAHFPQTRIIPLTTNAGYRRATNVGAHEAQGEYLVICNQDTKMDRDWLAQMVASIEADPSIGIVAPKILMFDMPHLINEAGNTLNYVGLYGSRGLGAPATKHDVPETLAAMSGCCFLIRADLWRRLGGFSGDFDQFNTGWHASFEDVDLAWRAQLLGFRVIFCPQARMYHKYESKGMTPQRFCSYEWGRYLTILRNYEIKTLMFLSPILVMLELGAWLYALLKGTPWLMAKARGMAWLAGHITELGVMRRQVQTTRTVSDWVVIRRMSSRIQLAHVMAKNHLARLVQAILDSVLEIYYHLLLAGLKWLDYVS